MSTAPRAQAFGRVFGVAAVAAGEIGEQPRGVPLGTEMLADVAYVPQRQPLLNPSVTPRCGTPSSADTKIDTSVRQAARRAEWLDWSLVWLRIAKKLKHQPGMVLPDRIELSTSPLPMECSTTELRQHTRGLPESAVKAPTGGAFSATSPPAAQARG